MNLFVAEKPSLGRAIAEVLCGNPKKNNGYLDCGESIVTWCFGHILENAETQYYTNKKEWDISCLPIIPQKWVKFPKKDTAAQLNIIKNLVSKADVIINAGDPDREGQLLVDEVLDYLHINKPVKRIWLQALDRENILKALKNLEDNKKYLPYKLSADARSKADWLVGMNFTQYFSLISGSYISVGRVQTPTLALIVNRDQTIENFKPHDYYTLAADLGSFQAVFKPSENTKGLDEEGRLIDRQLALTIVQETSNTTAKVISFSKEKKIEYPPMPFMLSSIQKKLSEKFGFTAKQSLDTVQSLYEKKLVTYPRTDCSYIAEEQHKDASRILKSLASIGFDISGASTSIKHRAFDSKKITAHTAIIPTVSMGSFSSLTDSEKKVFTEIANAYICLFLPPYEYYLIKTQLNIKGYTFAAEGRIAIKKGFKALCTDRIENCTIPDLQVGQILQTNKTNITTKQTTPPPRFTDGSIIDAMSHIHRYIDDENAKKVLKETDGIGTEATRASIIESLLKKKFIKRQGKQIISTPIGREIINQIPDWIKDPILTAKWERGLSGILNGTVTHKEFLDKQIQFIQEKLKEKQAIKISKNTNNNAIGKCSCGGSVVETPKTFKCEKCGKYVFKETFGKKLTPKEALSLIQDQETLVNNLRSKNGSKFSAKLRLVKEGEKWVFKMNFNK